jgi:hypothetical protein
LLGFIFIPAYILSNILRSFEGLPPYSKMWTQNPVESFLGKICLVKAIRVGSLQRPRMVFDGRLKISVIGVFADLRESLVAFRLLHFCCAA